MSNNKHILCADCGERHYFESANHATRELTELIRCAERVAALVVLAGMGLEMRLCYTGIDPAFFAKHAGHRLVVLSEYGDVEDPRCDTICNEPAPYRTADASYSVKCTLPKGHCGDHVARADGTETVWNGLICTIVRRSKEPKER
jgi:hypothetical protein